MQQLYGGAGLDALVTILAADLCPQDSLLPPLPGDKFIAGYCRPGDSACHPANFGVNVATDFILQLWQLPNCAVEELNKP